MTGSLLVSGNAKPKLSGRLAVLIDTIQGQPLSVGNTIMYSLHSGFIEAYLRSSDPALFTTLLYVRIKKDNLKCCFSFFKCVNIYDHKVNATDTYWNVRLCL